MRTTRFLVWLVLQTPQNAVATASAVATQCVETQYCVVRITLLLRLRLRTPFVAFLESLSLRIALRLRLRLRPRFTEFGEPALVLFYITAKLLRKPQAQVK